MTRFARAPGAGVLLTLLAFALLATGGCRRTQDHDKVQVHVLAAASLQEVARALEHELEREQPAVDVVLQFAGSQQLRTWIEHGIEADVFMTASLDHVEPLRQAGLTRRVVERAWCNVPVVVVPRDNPAGITTFADLGRARRLVLGVPGVPIGAYADRILARAEAELGRSFRDAVDAALVSRELDTRQVLARVELGEADAGIVYRTDARVAGEAVAVIEIPERFGVEAAYAVATLSSGAATQHRTDAWIELLASEAGQRILAEHGFVPCSDAGQEVP